MSAARAAAELVTDSDDQVMARVKTGSVPAFASLYDRYQDRAYRVAWTVCRDDGRAADAVQEAFMSIWNTRTGYETQIGNVTPWVLTVVRHRAIDIARRHGRDAARRANADCLQDVPAPTDVAERAQANAQTRELLILLTQLPDAQREVIALAFYGQLTHAEIAAHLNLPTGTVKGRMRLGLQRLRGDVVRVAS